MSIADVVEQRGWAFHGQAVGGVRSGVNADESYRVDAGNSSTSQRPLGAVEHDELGFIGDINQPAAARHEKAPGPILPSGDVQGLTAPSAAGGGSNDVAVAVGDGCRRSGHCAAGHRKLYERIQRAQRLVVGDMLLRLGCSEVGKAKIRGRIHLVCGSGPADPITPSDTDNSACVSIFKKQPKDVLNELVIPAQTVAKIAQTLSVLDRNAYSRFRVPSLALICHPKRGTASLCWNRQHPC